MASSPKVDKHEQCNKWVESGLRTNPRIQLLLRSLERLGCAPPRGFIRCDDCGDVLAAGGFGLVQETQLNDTNGAVQKVHRDWELLQDTLEKERQGQVQLRIAPEIHLCENHVQHEDHVHLTLQHELVHAIDMCRAEIDPLHNCLHMACTEIRANNLSGECDFGLEWQRGQASVWNVAQKYAGHGRDCVRRRSLLSVRDNPSCQARAAEYVDLAMSKCFADNFPFPKHPSQCRVDELKQMYKVNLNEKTK